MEVNLTGKSATIRLIVFKRLLLLVVILSGFVQSDTFGMEKGFGMKAGIVFSDFGTSGEIEELFLPNKEGLVGLSAGPFFYIKAQNRLSLQFEALYAQKGAKGWHYGTGLGGEVLDEKIFEEYNIHYLELPVLAKILLVKSKATRPYIIAGPAISVNLKTRYKLKHQSNSSSRDSDDFKTFNYGFVVGGGLELFDFLVEVRYNLGLDGANKTENEAFLKIKNRSMSILAGYHF